MDRGMPRPFIRTRFHEREAQFSPDGRWIAFSSNESGPFQTYVAPFPAGDRKWLVSEGAGSWPRWRGDGRELFYLARDNRTFMAVPVDTRAGEFAAGTPVRLFEIPVAATRSPYDVTPDGKRFLISTAASGALPPFTLVANWAEGLPEP
jgi:hypothetical protein